MVPRRVGAQRAARRQRGSCGDAATRCSRRSELSRSLPSSGEAWRSRSAGVTTNERCGPRLPRPWSSHPRRRRSPRRPTATTTTPNGQTSVTVAIICTTPEDASQGVVSAWIAGDQRRGRVAAPRKPRSPRSSRPAGRARNGRSRAASVIRVSRTARSPIPGGSAHFTLNGTEAEGWKVVQVGYVAD